MKIVYSYIIKLFLYFNWHIHSGKSIFIAGLCLYEESWRIVSSKTTNYCLPSNFFLISYWKRFGLVCLIFKLPYYKIIKYSECFKMYIISEVPLDGTMQGQFTEYPRPHSFLWNFLFNLWNMCKEAESHTGDINTFIWKLSSLPITATFLN